MRNLLKSPVIAGIIAKITNEARKPENQRKAKEAGRKAYDQFQKRRRTR